MISFKEFLDLVDKTYHEHSFEWRYGQTLMNVLHGVDPKQYGNITRTDYDCYYDDGIVRFTLDRLNKEWSNGY